MWIDAHCHLDDAQFVGDVDAVIERAAAAGVGAMITAGVDVASSRAVVALAQTHPAVYAAVGIHPHFADRSDAAARAEIRALAQESRVVAIGEIGLDLHYRDNPPLDVQTRNLISHLDLAAELGKPVVIHNRDADRALSDVLGGRGDAGARPRGMLHCFSSDAALAQQALAWGFLISFAGNLTFRNDRRLAEVARHLPRERVLVETDAPYLAPAPRRGRRNEPAFVVAVGERLAALWDVSISVVEQATQSNSTNLFGLPD